MLIGLTGQTGAGKSEVCGILLGYGFDIINADMVARDVTCAGSDCLREIADEFGDGVLQADKSLDRKALGAIVFSDAQRLSCLEGIIFPYILREIDERVRRLRPKSKGIFLDAPTLFESGASKSCDKICSVTAPKKLRIQRIIARDGITAETARQRMSSQHDDEYYTSRSDYVIINGGTKAELHGAVLDMLRALGLNNIVNNERIT